VTARRKKEIRSLKESFGIDGKGYRIRDPAKGVNDSDVALLVGER